MPAKNLLRCPCFRSILIPCLLLAAVLDAGQSLFAQTNGVLREVFYNLSGGGAVADLTSSAKFPNSPDEQFVEAAFEAPSNFADNYGQRMRALLVPPTTGSYVFWIATDDGGDLYLSTNEDSAKRVRIAYQSGWAGIRDYNKTATAKSAAISLTNGFRYYIEALQKEGAGGDNLAVAWQRPGDPPVANGAAPIPGQYLVPYGLGAPVVSVEPTNVAVFEGTGASFRIQLVSKLGVSFLWKRDGVVIPEATNATYILPFTTVADNGSQFQCFVQNAYGSTNSRLALLTVKADTTPPAITMVGSPGNSQVVTVVFSEPVEAVTATNPANYSISSNVKVVSVAFGSDTRSVILSTEPMAFRTNYTLNVSNVRDRAAQPNTIPSGSQWVFMLDTPPLDISLIRPPAETIGSSTRHGPITVSEIMFHPTNRPDGKVLEFVEVFNSNPYAEDIGGFRLSGDVDFVVPTNTWLGARSYTVIAAAPHDIEAVYNITNVLGMYTNRLSHQAGTVRLLNRQGGVLCEVQYASEPPWPAGADGGGHSLVLARPSLGESDPGAWAQSEAVGGSPGRAESATTNPYRMVMINEILAHTDPPARDFIELFNYSSAAIDISGCTLSDDATTNKFVILAGTVIQPLGFVCFDELQLGFGLSSGGETVYFRDPLGERLIDCLRFGGQENGVSFGRYPDGAAQFSRLKTPTPCGANTAARVSDVVINEVMYSSVSGDANDQYVELWNQGLTRVDLGGWRLEGGAKYTIPRGTVLPAGAYLVVAKDPSRLLTNYSTLNAGNTLGPWSGSLSAGGKALALTMPDEVRSTNSLGQIATNLIHIRVDEVTYRGGGRWGRYAKGGGSSLELVDVRADHRLASNWSDSDETAKSGWTTIEYTGLLQNGDASAAADSLQVILFGPGECLLDTVEVFTAGGANLVTNPTLDSGMDNWAAQGNHERSFWVPSGGYSGTGCLHIRASDRGDTGANRVRVKLKSALSAGQTATIRAKVRWLAGCPEILMRIRGNWLEATGNILTVRNLGTPGARNSRMLANTPPAISNVRHMPVLPIANQAVTVLANVDDPDGIAGLVLNYRVDPSTNYTSVSMVSHGAGVFSGSIPGQAAGKLAAFYIQALDNFTLRAAGRFPKDAPARECLVRWGDPIQSGGFGTYRLWMTQATFDRWSQREHLSNEPLDCTFVYGNSRVIYNMGGEYSGSPWHARGFNSPIGNVCDYLLTFPDDDRFLGEKDATLQWPGNGGGDNSYQREQTSYWIAEQMGLPYCYRRSINLFVNGVRRAEMYDDAQQPNGDLTSEFYPSGKNGDLHKIQIWFEFDDSAVNFTADGASFSSPRTLPVARWTFAKRAIQDSANNYTNLFKLMDAVNYNGLGQAYRNQLQNHVDVDNWLKTYAVEHIVGNNDSFAYGGGQNMYTYQPLNDTWKMLIWDIDFAFASLAPDSDVFQGIGRSNGIDLTESAYRRRYWEILYDLANGPLVATRVARVLDAKYNAMVANGRTIENPAAIKSYISSRRSYLLKLISINIPSGLSIILNNGADFSTSRNLIALTGKAGINIRTIAINGIPYPLTWTSANAWSVQVALDPGTNVLSVVGLDAAGNPIAGAQSSISVNYTGSAERPEDKLVINEIQYNPAVAGSSFVELYNTSAVTAFDLSGWRLGGVDFTFPGGVVIPPGGFLVIVADRLAFAAAYGDQVRVVGEFQGSLQNNGETLKLLKPGSTLADEGVVTEVRYDSESPWPAAANGAGSSLQLIDPLQANNRIGNWGATGPEPTSPGSQWRYVTATGTASSSTIYIYLQNVGTAYIDDVKLVSGSVAGSGPNLLANGGFESGFPAPWGVSPNLSRSSLSSTVKHSGASGLQLISTAAGSNGPTSINQGISPSLTLGAPYTLSFWYLEGTNAGNLTVRLFGDGIVASVPLLGGGPNGLARSTPGAVNSNHRTLAPLQLLWLNEICPANLSGITDRFGHRHPWLELYNSGPTNLTLDGCFLANNYSNLTQSPFPAGTSIGSNNFLVVWLDGNVAESSPAEPHVNFTAPLQVGSIALARTNAGATNILDYLNYHVLSADRSYGAVPDGHPASRQLLYFLTPGASNNAASPPLKVVINEWMAFNVATIVDSADGNFGDWFELYNYGDTVADLGGFYLSSTITNKTKFHIPQGYTIPAHGYLLGWADNQSGQNSSNSTDLHVNFKLARAGESIGLFAPDGSTVIDYIAFGPQLPDVSEGRWPDGGDALIALSSPTPRSSNFLLNPNHPPQLGGIPDHTVFAGELLVVQALASDSDQPLQTLSFSLDSGCPAAAFIQTDSGLFSWRPASANAPSTNQITVRVSDDGIPSMSAAATFTVIVLSLPKVTAIESTGNGGYGISFATVPGIVYRVDYKDDLNATDWQVLAPEATAAGESLSITDPAVKTQRFYRIVVIR